MPPLSPETKALIEKEAKQWADKGAFDQFKTGNRSATVYGQCKQDYIAGATAYANYKEESERYITLAGAITDVLAREGINYLLPAFVIARLSNALNPPAGEQKEVKDERG